MSPVERFDENSRALGRIEQQLETIAERGKDRDTKLDKLDQRQHKAANAIQELSSQVTTVQKGIDQAKVDIGDVKSRLSALEAPIKKAMAQRKSRRQLWAKVVTVAVTISGAVWFVAQPILKAVSEVVVNAYLPNGK